MRQCRTDTTVGGANGGCISPSFLQGVSDEGCPDADYTLEHVLGARREEGGGATCEATSSILRRDEDPFRFVVVASQSECCVIITSLEFTPAVLLSVRACYCAINKIVVLIFS